MMFLVFLVPAVITGALGALFLKIGSQKLDLKTLMRNYQLALGLFLYGLSMIFYLPALRLADLSIVYPLSSMTYVLVALLSSRFLKESMTAWKWVGIIFIISGSFVILT